MGTRRIDDEIDRLYQLPLNDFTAARNALAKLAGAESARIRALTKPSIVAWAVNQLYWRRRETVEALVEAAVALRGAHAAVLSGQRGDLRAVGKAHEAQLEIAITVTLAMLSGDGLPATDATRQAIAITLRSLPTGEPLGRLTHALQPGGFEMLAGLSLGRVGAASRPKAVTVPAPIVARATLTPTKGDAATRTRARDAAAAAARAVLQAEHVARRADFERARAAREVERAAKAAADAARALERATEEASEAARAAATAVQAHENAERTARDAEHAVDAARTRAQTARRDLEVLER